MKPGSSAHAVKAARRRRQGRNHFHSDSPVGMIKAVRAIVHTMFGERRFKIYEARRGRCEERLDSVEVLVSSFCSIKNPHRGEHSPFRLLRHRSLQKLVTTKVVYPLSGRGFLRKTLVCGIKFGAQAFRSWQISPKVSIETARVSSYSF